MARFRRLSTAALAGVTAAAPLGAPAAAHAGTAPRWSAPTVLETAGADAFSVVTAAGADDIWAGGLADVSIDDGVVPIRHWNGTKWARVSAPAKVTDRVADLSTGGTGNTWLLAGPGLYRRAEGKWVSAGTHGDGVTAIAAVGRNELFAAYTGGIRHRVAGTWTTAPMPDDTNINAVRARGAGDVWAVGETTDGDVQQPFAAHWDGTSWTRTPMPDVPTGPDGNLVDINDVAFVGADDVYAGGLVQTGVYDTHPVLLHWDGSAWATVETPSYVDNGLNDLAADGRGGLWATSYAVQGVLRRSPSGTWSTEPLPGSGHPQVASMARIPGTRHVIGAGQVVSDGTNFIPAVMRAN